MPAASSPALEVLRQSVGPMPVLAGKRVEDAFALAERAYAEDRHWSGGRYMDHALSTLRLLLTFAPDEETVIASLLRYVPDTKRVTLTEIRDRFGDDVRTIVANSHLLGELSSRPRRFSIDTLRMMMIRLCEDPRALLLFLCGRTVALESLSQMPMAERKRQARLALRLLSPLAASVGVYALKHMIEARAFPTVYPDDAERIAAQRADVQGAHGSFLETAAAKLRDALNAHGIKCTVEAREKQPYSIFTKMNLKGVSRLTAVYDLFALRVVLEKEDDCYVALGLLHRIAHPVPNRFKDYIAFPKPNGYQSLHTTVTGVPGVPPGMFTEVQIRTKRMHEEAEYGIAAHWNYKQGGTPEQALRRFQLLKAADRQHLTGEAAPFVDLIFVLTPKGDVVELPEGATPLDFAFQVHTDIGLAFRAARVNGAIAPLTYTLENGDVVEIIKSAKPQPSPRWLKLLKTASARSRLKRYLVERQEPHAQHAEAPVVAKPKLKKGEVPKRPDGPPYRAVDTGIDVPMPLKTALCCKPVRESHEQLVGVITRGGVIRVHRASCKLTKQVNPERRVKVEWNG